MHTWLHADAIVGRLKIEHSLKLIFPHPTKLPANRSDVNSIDAISYRLYTGAMSRANFMTSRWNKAIEAPLEGSLCWKHPELPWIDDQTPSPDMILKMRAVCANCPAVRECALRALSANHKLGMVGGMYAGQWIPWKTKSEGCNVRAQRRRALGLLAVTATLGVMDGDAQRLRGKG